MELLVTCPTEQQNTIRDCALRGKNLRVCAHAGSGKTTTLLWAVGQLPPIDCQDGEQSTRRILFLEYNRDLRIEAKERARAAGLHQVMVHNYDSFLVEFYDPAAPSHDFQLALRHVLLADVSPLKKFGFETVVVDEVQDMTEEYKHFVLKILKDNKSLVDDVQLVLAGDPKQTIYGFRGARSEYLLSPQEDWPGSSEEYPVLLTLGKTFRFGSHICKFVNELCRSTFLKEAWQCDIEPADPQAGGSIELWEMDEDEPKALLERYEAALKTGSSTAIMSSSIREENTCLSRFVEACNEIGRGPFEGAEEEEDAVANLHHQKEEKDQDSSTAVLRTIHTSKGKQYDTVFLFLVQATQWLTPSGSLKPDRSTVLYVGATRAKRTLIIVQDSEDKVAEKLWQATNKGGCDPRALWGNLRSATTGYPPVQLKPPVKLHQIHWSRGSDVTHLDKNLRPSQKDDLLSALDYTTCIFDNIMKDAPTNIEELALFLRFSPPENRPGAPLEHWASGTKTVGPDVVYSRLALGPQVSHIYLPHFGEFIDALSPHMSTWQDWFIMANFHPSRRYGHAQIKGESEPRVEVCEEMHRRLSLRVGGSHQVEAHAIDNPACLAVCSHNHLFYCTGNEVVTPIFAATEGTRPADVFAVVIAAARLGFQAARIDYLQRGVSVRIQGNFDSIGRATVRRG